MSLSFYVTITKACLVVQQCEHLDKILELQVAKEMVEEDQLSDIHLREVLGARPFRFFPQIASTNDVARQWAVEGASGGSVVIADEQIAGRGRFGRNWSAPAGTALLMSVILRPRLAPERFARLTMVGAVSVAEVLEDLAPGKVGLKWPNDVQLNGRKAAGILAETTVQEALTAVILGIGLNVRVDFSGTPLEGQAASVEPVSGKHLDRAVLLDKLLRRIDYWSIRVEEADLLEAWRGRITTIGQRITARTIGEQAGELVGLAVGVADDGGLLLRADDGTIHRIMAGEVTLAT